MSGDVDSILTGGTSFLEGIASIDKPVNWAIGIWATFTVSKVLLGNILPAAVAGLSGSTLGEWLATWLMAGGAGGASIFATLAPIVIPIAAILSIVSVGLNKNTKIDAKLEEGDIEGANNTATNLMNWAIAGSGPIQLPVQVLPETANIPEAVAEAFNEAWANLGTEDLSQYLENSTATGITQGVINGLNNVLAYSDTGSLASVISAGIDLGIDMASPTAVTKLQQILTEGFPVAETIADGISGVEDISPFEAASLATNLETASGYLDNIIGQVGSEAWANFKADIALFGGEGEGSLAGAFSAGQTAAESLMTFLNTDFTDALNTVVSLFSRLMTGHWNINVTVSYLGATRNQTGGSILPSQLSIVGETGTELFSPPTRGHITSHSELSSILSQVGRSGGKSGNEYNIQVTGSPVAMTEDELLRTLRRVEFLHG